MKSNNLVKILCFFFIFSSFKAMAQLPHISIYAHGLYASAINSNASDRYKFGLGGVGGITIGSESTRFVGSVGYTDFFSKHDSPDHTLGDQVYIPVKAGVRKYLPLTLHALFIQGDLGVGFLNYKNADNDHSSAFAADIGAGAHFGPLEAALTFDTFKPSYWSSWVNFQLGFTFGL